MPELSEMNRKSVLILISFILLAGYACKSRKQTESFPSREAFSNPSVDSQLTVIRQLLPEAETELVPKGIKVTLASKVLFGVNSSSLSSPAKEQLATLAGVLNKFPDTQVLVEGHTDVTGTTEYNQTLSEKRAVAVKDYLVSQGINAARITAAGYGEQRPVATNSTPEGQERNRRVELFISR